MEAQIETLPVVSTRGLEGVLVAAQEPNISRRLPNHLTDTSEQLLASSLHLFVACFFRNIFKRTRASCSQSKTKCNPLQWLQSESTLQADIGKWIPSLSLLFFNNYYTFFTFSISSIVLMTTSVCTSYHLPLNTSQYTITNRYYM